MTGMDARVPACTRAWRGAAGRAAGPARAPAHDGRRARALCAARARRVDGDRLEGAAATLLVRRPAARRLRRDDCGTGLRGAGTVSALMRSEERRVGKE